jgi:hypothetical protein
MHLATRSVGFLSRGCLASKAALVNFQIDGVRNANIRGYAVPRAEHNEISRDEFIGEHRALRAITARYVMSQSENEAKK